jgi:organic radical activating enzyme
MIIKSFASHYIDDINNPGFSEQDYSKFKFGSSFIGKEFGSDLCELLLKKNLNYLRSFKKIIIYSSPYDFIPTATLSMTKEFYERLKDQLTDYDVEIELGKIHRNTTYTIDYGTLSAKERLDLISNDIFDIDNKFEGTELLIFIDDVKITGSHEFVVKKMLKSKKITNPSFFLYHAILDDSTIDPQYENELNYSYVKGVKELINITNKDDFILNTRFTKYILKLKETEFEAFFKEVSSGLIKSIITNAEGNGYNKITDYSKNLKKIITLAESC